LVNVTQELNVGGSIAVLQAESRLALNFDTSLMKGTDWGDAVDQVRSNPKCQIFSAKHFREPRHFHCDVVDWAQYAMFQQPLALYKTDPAYFAGVWSTGTNYSFPRVMSAVMIHISRPPQVQSWVMSNRNQSLTRHKPDSVLGGMMHKMPSMTGPADKAAYPRGEGPPIYQ
jgi:hypothetical protein